MSSDANAIRVDNLGKCYHIYAQPQDRLKQFLFPRLNSVIGRTPKPYYHEFWALHDVSFEIKKGETIGIIGRNGSGKSTLLQLICGTLAPSAGTVSTNGRIAALLELGAGFNPEFTGRDNVYMNGAILGLSKAELDARIDRITAFADIGDFIEQPVKTYSSGMMVRLAFSVIAHVDADILVIDEALAVGDAVFTHKCMRFLRRFMQTGTVLFVSHDVNAVNNFCQGALWLDHGSMRMFSQTSEVTKAYVQYCKQESYGSSVKLNSLTQETEGETIRNNDGEKTVHTDTTIRFYEDIANSEGWKTGAAEIVAVSIAGRDGKPATIMLGGEKVVLRVEAIAHQPLASPIIGFFVKDRLGQSLFGDNTYSCADAACVERGKERLVAEFVFSLPLLPNGEYSVTVAIADGDMDNYVQHHFIHNAAVLTVQSSKLRYGLMGITFDSITIRRETGRK